MDKLLKSGEVAELLGLSPKTIYRLAIQGKIPSIQISGGGSVRFERDQIIKWLNQQRRQSSDNLSSIISR